MRMGMLSALPVAGFLVDVVNNDYTKKFLADFLVAIIDAIGTAVVHSIVQSIFGG